ncbi:extracellular solute-binding protein [Paenibacillus mendelii]|uniref:Extracellular solute-binding protein n=1 Tax=Paenibacillus mendelii TaxID=206163 RepID=A0ABV6J615_9BACL|nr:extracellular solute-binding protein [Paenibacillus mendelii]MCQ6559966.1 extracellular solute-binding protein [Paenibacillus mendelii]
MVKRTKTAVAAALICMLLILSACSDNSGEEAAPAEPSGQVDETSVVDVSFYAVPPGDVVDLNTNWFTNYVKDTFRLNIEWIMAPSSDAATKQSLLLSGGNYPDVFWSGSFSLSEVLRLSKQGILVPLNSYIDKYAPNLKKTIDTAPGLKQAVTAPDGNIYGLTMYNSCLHCYWGQKYWINKSYLEKFNLTMPTTTDEFEKVLQVFKDNGLIPLSGTSDSFDPTVFLMNAFTYDNANDLFDLKDGKVVFAPAQGGWKNGLAYMNRLFSKGLIDKQAFSQKSEVLKPLIAQDKVAVVPSLTSSGFLDPGHQSYSNWVTMAPLTGPDGMQYAAFSGNTPRSLSFAVTNKATEEQIVRIMKLLDFIYTPEGTQTMNYGAEGKYWTKAAPGIKGLNGEQALFITQSDKFYSAGAKQNEGWNQMGPTLQDMTWRNGFVEAKPPFSADGLESLLLLETMRNYTGHQPDQVYPGAIWMEPEEYQKYALLKTNIEQYVKQWKAQFILGSKSVEKDWEAYLKGLDKLGLAEYLDMAQKAMKEPFDTTSYKPDQKTIDFLSSLK